MLNEVRGDVDIEYLTGSTALLEEAAKHDDDAGRLNYEADSMIALRVSDFFTADIERKQEAARKHRKKAKKLRARAAEAGEEEEVRVMFEAERGGRTRFGTMLRTEFEALAVTQLERPYRLGAEGNRAYFWYRDKVWVTREELTEEDVDALVMEGENRKRLKLQKAHALKAMTEQLDTKAKRQPIATDIKVAVWQRDGGRCVECGSNENLEYDHIIPVSMGGANTERNLQLLCEPCNRRKGASLG